MPKKVRPIPKGFHTLSAILTVRDAKSAIEFYKKAFGAQLPSPPSEGPGGKIMHAALKIGDSMLMLADEFSEFGSVGPQSLGGSPVTIHIYTENADALFEQAVTAGAKVTMPLADQFWGDRYGKLEDPFGHRWSVATHKEELTPEEIDRRGQAAFAEVSKKARQAQAN
jgi:PhnB protein